MKTLRVQKYLSILLFIALVVSFQNCSVYNSEGIAEYESTLSGFNSGSACLPYLDVNDAARFMGISNGVAVTANRAMDPMSCIFTSRNGASSITDKVVCQITTSSGTTLSDKAQASTQLYTTPPLSDTDALAIISGFYNDLLINFSFYSAEATEEMYGYSFEDSGTAIYKFVGGKRGADISNVCSGGSCAECTYVSLTNKSSITSDQEEQIRYALSQMVYTIIQRN